MERLKKSQRRKARVKVEKRRKAKKNQIIHFKASTTIFLRVLSKLIPIQKVSPIRNQNPSPKKRARVFPNAKAQQAKR